MFQHVPATVSTHSNECIGMSRNCDRSMQREEIYNYIIIYNYI